MNRFNCGCEARAEVTTNQLYTVSTRCEYHEKIHEYKNLMYLARCGCFITYPRVTGYSWKDFPCELHAAKESEYNALETAMNNELDAVRARYKTMLRALKDECPLLH